MTPDINDQMRSLTGGKESFWRIVANLRHAVNYLSATIRMNVDNDNFKYAAELFRLLAALSGAGTRFCRACEPRSFSWL